MPQRSPDEIAAYALWIELSTRITTQELHYRSGNEETAARSVASLFEKSRDLLAAHPDADAFRSCVMEMLNVTIRPYTARWHGWMMEGKSVDPKTGEATLVFRDQLVRRMFRDELRKLREELVTYQDRFSQLAGVHDEKKAPEKRRASLGKSPLAAGIGQQIKFASSAEIEGRNAAEEINRKEHEEILNRRAAVRGLEPEKKLTDATGIALSGGGIRSATYCLGIVQVLVRKGLFAHFDYLSTVSGGGYLGTFISCALGTEPSDAARDAGKATPKGAAKSDQKSEHLPAPPSPPAPASITRRINDAFHWKENGTESGLLRHLRNNSKYLLNGGVAAKLKIAGLLISGILWNFLMVVPLPAAAAVAAYYLGVRGHFWGPALEGGRAALTATSHSLAWWLVVRAFQATAIALFVLPIVYLFAHGKPPASRLMKFRRFYITVALTIGVITGIAVLLYFQPALFHFYEWLRRSLGGFTHFGSIANWAPPAVSGAASVILGLVATILKDNWPRLKRLAMQLFILSGPVFFGFLYLMIGNGVGLGRDAAQWDIISISGGAALLLTWSAFWLNVNTLAPHVYYRAKLCECYLARRRAVPAASGRLGAMVRARKMMQKWLTGEFGEDRTEALQKVPLGSLGASPAAPYHLLNMIVNLPGSDSKELRGRDGDFFFASKHFCGAPLVGYQPTDKVESKDAHFDLGTAMAVSGAAASTNMGWKSLPNFRFLLSMLNVRLGYWLRWERGRGAPGLAYFISEMSGGMNEHGSFLNLSDGGHIENLGAYELLRRRCKFIVCVDGGQEPGMECADLTRLQRYAQIDFGIVFEYGIADLSIQSNGFSRASAILVKIIYPGATRNAPPEHGWMIYIKLSVTGVEPVYVLDYRRENPMFPHQSTADQIYDEAQFEAYRRLGECAAENLFREELCEKPPTDIRDWFQSLADKMLSDNDPVFPTPESSLTAAGSRKE